MPIVFRQAIFQRDDRILGGPITPESHHLLGRVLRFIGLLEDVLAIFEKFASGGVEGDGNLLSRFVASLLNGLDNQFNGLDVRFERGSESAFVADRGVVSPFLEHVFQRMKCFRAPAQRLAEAGGADRHDHEFLEIYVVIGMGAAIENVHHGNRQKAGAGAPQIAIERRAE